MPDPNVRPGLTGFSFVDNVHFRGIHTCTGSGAVEGIPLATMQPSSLGESSLSNERTNRMAAMAFAFASTGMFANPVFAAWMVRQTLEVPAAASNAQSDVVDRHESIAAIRRHLQEEPIEDGITHSAQAQLRTHILSFGEGALLDAVQASDTPAHAAAWLRLLGRSTELTARTREALARFGLANHDVEIRDAAVQAVENWGDRSLSRLLREREEPVAWLREYAAAVARDLEG